MAFKQNPNKKPRWEELSKTALIKTVKTLNARQTKLLNQIAKLEERLAEANNLIASVAANIEAGPAPVIDRLLDNLASVAPFPWEQK